MRLGLLVLMFLPAVPVAAAGAMPPPGHKTVLVTGASSGLGRSITERLARDGWFVYAGARKDADLKALSALPDVQGVRLDVTSDADIAAAVATVQAGGHGLDALVNNAGIATFAPMFETPQSEYDLVMAVDLHGPYRITRAFAPLLIKSRGRVTTIGSLDGIICRSGIAIYCMAKHGVESFTDSLALELEPLGVKASIVEPGSYNSHIDLNMARRLGNEHTAGDRSEYKNPDEVAAAVEQALSDPNPKRRYMVAPVESQAQITIRRQIAQLVELNEGQPYTYDRKTLIRMLDEALAHARPRTK